MKNCFTLIELLVVIVIIAILAGMLLPALNKARDKAREASCTSNSKQLGVAYAMYTDAFNGFMPKPISDDGRGDKYKSSDANNYATLPRLLTMYLGRNTGGNIQVLERNPVFECPLVPWTDPALNAPRKEILAIGRWANGLVHFGTTAFGGYNLVRAKSPSQKAVQICELITHRNAQLYRPSLNGGDTGSFTAGRSGFHAGKKGTGAVFIDGHAATIMQPVFFRNGKMNENLFDPSVVSEQ